MIDNPIFPGFNPDPCVCRKGEDIYVAVSSFEWLPGIPIYHSRDMKHWELYAHALDGDSAPDLRNLPSAKGIWAPCLTWCEEEGLFYVIYGIMRSMNARYFDIDNYLITAKDLKGPWSEPVYLHSAGFDASILHDTDGRKYIVSLEWETRIGYEQPGAICLAEYDPKAKKILGFPRRIWRGCTDRGCIEAPHITRRGDYYYLMCAEGGTGYNHCATMARARSPWGPYEADPAGPVITSQPKESDERKDPDHLKPQYYNPDILLQKAGHASYVDLPTGETYLFYHCSRPFLPELRCTLGRETAVQKACWTENGWLRLAEGTNLAVEKTAESKMNLEHLSMPPEEDHFDSAGLGNWYYAPRVLPDTFAETKSRPGWVCLKGQESQASLHHFSLLARKLTSLNIRAETVMDFSPEVFQQSAGLMVYYDNMNNVCLRKTWSEEKQGPIIGLLRIRNGERMQYEEIAVPEEPLWFGVSIQDRVLRFFWKREGGEERTIGPELDMSEFSDEYCKYGEFTGTMVGLFCIDSLLHSRIAAFDCFNIRNQEQKQRSRRDNN